MKKKMVRFLFPPSEKRMSESQNTIDDDLEIVVNSLGKPTQPKMMKKKKGSSLRNVVTEKERPKRIKRTTSSSPSSMKKTSRTIVPQSKRQKSTKPIAKTKAKPKKTLKS